MHLRSCHCTRCNRWIVIRNACRAPRSADARDLGLDRTEEGLVNLAACMPQNQHCRTHQAVRNRNHRIAARRGNKLGLEAGWRSQHAADDDAAAYHDRARADPVTALQKAGPRAPLTRR